MHSFPTQNFSSLPFVLRIQRNPFHHETPHDSSDKYIFLFSLILFSTSCNTPANKMMQKSTLSRENVKKLKRKNFLNSFSLFSLHNKEALDAVVIIINLISFSRLYSTPSCQESDEIFLVFIREKQEKRDCS